MWLINANSMKLERFADEFQVHYAILSHRWQRDELSFQDVQDSKGLQNLSRRKGFAKIESACNWVRWSSLTYLWADTCCIDKSSSAELSEAINSMYRYYREAEVCYVYLSDVHSSNPKFFPYSEWFKRGWTLQELLAPQRLTFFNSEWNVIGSRTALIDEIHTVTTIDKEALYGRPNLHSFSIAERMRWAAQRKTTRVEDIAYSLMGIFDVNMPLLYGEGSKAFFRLQEAIIAQSDDHSIFAWTFITNLAYTGLLAASPSYFINSKGIASGGERNGDQIYSMTNRGLSIELELMPWSGETYIARLNAGTAPSGGLLSADWQNVSIFLQRLSSDDQYVRTKFHRKDLLPWPSDQNQSVSDGRIEGRRRRVYVLNLNHLLRQSSNQALPGHVTYGFQARREILLPASLTPGSEELHSMIDSHKTHRVYFSPGTQNNAAWMLVQNSNSCYKYLIFLFDFDFNPICVLVRATNNDLIEPQQLARKVAGQEMDWEPYSKGVSRLSAPYNSQSLGGYDAFKGQRNQPFKVYLDYPRELFTIEIQKLYRSFDYIWTVMASTGSSEKAQTE